MVNRNLIKNTLGINDDELIDEVLDICTSAYIDGMCSLRSQLIDRIYELDYFFSSPQLCNPVMSLYSESHRAGQHDRDLELFTSEVA
jgi:hypothetical protein